MRFTTACCSKNWSIQCFELFSALLVFLCFLLLDCQYSQYMSMLQHVLHFLHCDLFQSFVELWGISWCRFPQSSFFWIVLSQHLNNLGSGTSPSTPCPHRMHVVRNRKQWNAAFRCTSKIIELLCSCICEVTYGILWLLAFRRSFVDVEDVEGILRPWASAVSSIVHQCRCF